MKSIGSTSNFTLILKIEFNEIWKKGALRIVYFVSKFATTLRIKNEKTRFKLLNKKIVNIFNDKSLHLQKYIDDGLIYDR